MVPRGAFPRWVGCLTPPRSMLAHREGSALGFSAGNGATNSSLPARGGCRFLSALMYRRLQGSRWLFRMDLGPSWSSDLRLRRGPSVTVVTVRVQQPSSSGAARSKPAFGKLTLVAAGGRETSRQGRLPCAQLQKDSRFFFFFRESFLFCPFQSRRKPSLPLCHVRSIRLLLIINYHDHSP